MLRKLLRPLNEWLLLVHRLTEKGGDGISSAHEDWVVLSGERAALGLTFRYWPAHRRSGLGLTASGHLLGHKMNERDFQVSSCNESSGVARSMCAAAARVLRAQKLFATNMPSMLACPIHEVDT